MNICRFALNSGKVLLVLALLMSMGTVSMAQSNSADSGCVPADQVTIDMDDNLVEGEGDLPWIPILSPNMICLDVWITRALKIHKHYSQEAAENYFLYAEYGDEIPLPYDPCPGTALGYTILSPIYAACPGILMRDYVRIHGFLLPIHRRTPAMGYYTPTGMSQPVSAPAATKPVLEPMNNPTETVQQSFRTDSAYQANSSRWSQVSDADILAHYGYDPNLGNQSQPATVRSSFPQQPSLTTTPLDAPVVPSAEWEFVDAEEVAGMAGARVSMREETGPSYVEQPPVYNEVVQPAQLEQPAHEWVPEVQETDTQNEYDYVQQIGEELYRNASRPR